MVLKQLPIRASLARYEEQSKKLIKAYKSGDPEAIQCIRQHHPRLAGRANTNDRNEVTDANIQSDL